MRKGTAWKLYLALLVAISLAVFVTSLVAAWSSPAQGEVSFGRPIRIEANEGPASGPEMTLQEMQYEWFIITQTQV